MMIAKILDKTGKNEWDEYVQSHPRTISWHSFDFHTVIQRNYNITFYPIAVYDGDKICGVLPLYHLKTALTKEILISCPYVVAGGIAADDEKYANALLDEAIVLSQKHNSCKIILKHYKYKHDGHLLTDDNFYNRELDLTQSEEAIWDGFDELNRQNIKAADKYNLQFEYPFEDIDSFYEVVFKQHHDKGIPCPSKRWIESKYRYEGNSYKLAVIKLDNKIVAVTMAKQFKKTVSLPYTAILHQNEEHFIFAYKLYWDLIRKLKSEGIEVCHSGRVPNNDTVDSYRLGWGGPKEPYYYQYYPDTGVQTEFSVKRGKKRELFEKVWKVLPKWVVRICGPIVVKQFP